MSGENGSRRAVAVGGGSGLPSSIDALLDMGFETSAVVAMSDNGGSTGTLRENVGIIPPGDIRNCIVAMASDENEPLVPAIQYRFPPFADEPRGHALGNLMLTALTQTTGSFMKAIEVMEEMVGARGHVFPSTVEDVQLKGIDRDGNLREGQVEVSDSTAAIDRVWLEPQDAPAYSKALKAIEKADLVVFGPGSLYTSVIPNILTGGFVDALTRSPSRKILVCNVSNQQNETHDLTALDHVRALKQHGLGEMLDAVIVHDHRDSGSIDTVRQPIVLDQEERDQIEAMGVAVFTADVVDPQTPWRHSSEKLAAAIEAVLQGECHPERREGPNRRPNELLKPVAPAGVRLESTSTPDLSSFADAQDDKTEVEGH